MNLLDPIMDQIGKLWARVNDAPVVRRGTVTQAAPLLVQLDGDIDTSGNPVSTPAQSVIPVTLGDRVECVEQHRRVRVITGKLPAASTSQPGIAELATQAEVNARDSTRILTAATAGGASWAPYAFAAGSVTITASHNAAGTVAVTFPTGRFSQTPIINLTMWGAGPNRVVDFTGPSSTDMTIRIHNTSGAQVTHTVHWTAVQMTQGSSAG